MDQLPEFEGNKKVIPFVMNHGAVPNTVHTVKAYKSGTKVTKSLCTTPTPTCRTHLQCKTCPPVY